MNTTAKHVKYNGAILININVAQTAVNRIIQQQADEARINLNPIELYIMAALLQQDGIFASTLAAKVGRAATSFTPNLDKLQKLGFIERKADANGDRRAVNIHATTLAKACGDLIRETLETAESKIRKAAGVTDEEWATYQKVIAALQNVE
jgi:DNA-binding MarR family transcriptional regulator